MRKKNDILLDRLEQAINDLRLQYDIFFNGGSERWPEKAHADLQRELNVAMNLQSLDYAQRYRLNSLVSRLSLLGDLWRRNLRKIEQGTKPAFGVRKGRVEDKSK
jgi:hypothetical protein